MGGLWREVISPEDIDRRVQVWTPAAREPGRTVWRLFEQLEWRYAPNLPGESVTTLLTRYGPAFQPAGPGEPAGWAPPGEVVLAAPGPTPYEVRRDALNAAAARLNGWEGDHTDDLERADRYVAWLNAEPGA